MKNLHAPVLRVLHSNLERANPDSAFRTRCPACREGLLMVFRDPVTLALTRDDYCTRCGQRVYYCDEIIWGEPVWPVLTGEDRIARARAEGAAEERTRVVAWLRGPHLGSDTEGWDGSVRQIFNAIAADLERGAHRETKP